MEILDQPTNSNPDERSIQEVIDYGYEFNFGDYFSRTFQLFGKYWGYFLGNVALMIALFVLIGIVGLSLFVPEMLSGSFDTSDLPGFFLNILIFYGFIVFVTLFIATPFWYGRYVMMRNGETGGMFQFGDFFSVFKTHWLKIVGAIFLIALISNLSFILLGIFFFAQWSESIIALMQGDSLRGMEVMSAGDTFNLLNGLCYIPYVYFIVSYSLSIPLILFQNAGVWEAMEGSRKIVSKQWFIFFGFLVVMIILSMLGVFACVIGLIVTIHFYDCAIYSAYEDIFQKQSKRTSPIV